MNQKPKYTQGEWSINEWTQKDRNIRIGAIGTPLIATIEMRDVSINEHKANAHLITAAPNTFEALVGCRDMLREAAKQLRGRGDSGHAAVCEAHIKAANEAIRKALGASKATQEKCFACDKPIQPGKECMVETADHQTVYVGSECYRKVKAAAKNPGTGFEPERGYQPPKGGPRLYDTYGN